MNKSTEKGELGSEGGPTWTESTHTVSEAEAARLLGVKRNTLGAWRARHQGRRYLKFSWKVRYRQSVVEKFVSDSVDKGRNSFWPLFRGEGDCYEDKIGRGSEGESASHVQAGARCAKHEPIAHLE